MIHQKFDNERWKNLFSLDKLRKQARDFVEDRRRQLPGEYKSALEVERHVKLMSPGGEMITSPLHLAVVEQVRDECLSRRYLPTFPTDVFVFAKGEPQNRCVTKVGGLPFWPKTRKWPMGTSGKPMAFLAQFCFADSADLIGSLPGDILVIFADGVYGKDWKDGDAGALQFEWVSRSESRLVDASDIPQTRWELLPVYGEIHRTKDYLVGSIGEEAWWRILFNNSKSPREFFSGLGARRALEKGYTSPWCIAVIEGTKIGGIPRWIQYPEKLPGRFLCTLGSINPVWGIGVPRPYPFTNVEGPLVFMRKGFRTAEEEIPRDRLLMWGDAGSLYLFLDDRGSMHWTTQCY